MPIEHTALDAALIHAASAAGDHAPTLPLVVAALVDPGTGSSADVGLPIAELRHGGRDLAHGLRRIVRGDLAGMFDGPSTVRLDATAPMTVLDLSRIGSHDDALAIAMACSSAWLESAVTSGTGKRWIIYDEGWRLLNSLPLLRRMQSQWKLSRAHGIANLLVLHRLSDLDAAGASGSEIRAVAEGLLADCSTRIIYGRRATSSPKQPAPSASPAPSARCCRCCPGAPGCAAPPSLLRRADRGRPRRGQGLRHRATCSTTTPPPGWAMTPELLAEAATLGSLLLIRPPGKRVNWLRVDDFSDPWHREMYAVIAEDRAAGRSSDAAKRGWRCATGSGPRGQTCTAWLASWPRPPCAPPRSGTR